LTTTPPINYFEKAPPKTGGYAKNQDGKEHMSKTLHAILQILSEHQDTIIGSRELSRILKLHGVELTERTVRYHLKILDERGLTRVFGKEGRKITKRGLDELSSSHVSDRVGFIISKIENLSYRTSFDIESGSGRLVLNVSLFPEEDLHEALRVMKRVFASPYVMSDRVVMARAGERIGSLEVPEGKIGIGTICSVTINGILLKAGIPVASRFGGLLQVTEEGPARFTALIGYEGSSLDPHLIFIKSRMTSVLDVIKHSEGSVLASFREIPVASLEQASQVSERLHSLGIGGILTIGSPNQPLLEIPVGLDRAGLCVVGGLNPLAALEEVGIETTSAAMSELVEFAELRSFKEVSKGFASNS
jgi:repressor of nif and glnA expression